MRRTRRSTGQVAVGGHSPLSLAPVGDQKVPYLDGCSHIRRCMPKLRYESCTLNELPATFPSGPAVTFPIGVQPVDLSADEDSNLGAPEDRQFVRRYITHVYQPVPRFYKSLHVVLACFGKYESEPAHRRSFSSVIAIDIRARRT